jgi:hypothetical protein
MAEHNQRHRIGARRDPTPAVGNDPLVESSDAIKPPAELCAWKQRIGFRIEQIFRGDVYAALDVARSAIMDTAGEKVLVFRQRINRTDRRIADR